MPALPELARALREVRPVEVLGQADPEEPCEPDRDVRVACEVEVDLERIRVDAQQQGARAERARRIEAAIDDDAEAVREDHLLEQARHDPHRAVLEIGGRGPRHGLELREQALGPHDRPGDELREEGHVEREVEQVVGRPVAPPVDLERVAHRLERVEGDADGQRDVEPRPQRRFRGQQREVRQTAGEEGAVLEVAEQAEVARDAREHEEAPAPHRGRAREPPRHRVVEQGRERDEAAEERIPRHVERVAGDEQDDLARAGARGPQQAVVGDQHDRHEHGELGAVEEHARSAPGPRKARPV